MAKPAIALSLLATSPALAEQPASPEALRVRVTIENLAPKAGTLLTPVWVGFHEGNFDTYDGLTPASNDPRPGSVAMERLCEDGNNQPIADDFADLSAGVDASLAGPSGPIATGEMASQSFILDPSNPNHRFFSYASMILPSNDFCVSNGNPRSHPIFDEQGNLVAEDFFVAGSEVLDAGTEVNDEVPANTAFFGQQAPDTGVDENGRIGTIGSDLPNVGFLPRGSGGILDDPRFRMADFIVPGYPVLKVSFTAAPAIVADLDFETSLSGKGEGYGSFWLRNGGQEIAFSLSYTTLRRVTDASLTLGESGPVLARLLPEDLSSLSKVRRRQLRRGLTGTLTAADLAGALEGQPLDALTAALKENKVYVNIQTARGALQGRIYLQ